MLNNMIFMQRLRRLARTKGLRLERAARMRLFKIKHPVLETEVTVCACAVLIKRCKLSHSQLKRFEQVHLAKAFWKTLSQAFWVNRFEIDLSGNT